LEAVRELAHDNARFWSVGPKDHPDHRGVWCIEIHPPVVWRAHQEWIAFGPAGDDAHVNAAKADFIVEHHTALPRTQRITSLWDHYLASGASERAIL
jgi:hypothetical protein